MIFGLREKAVLHTMMSYEVDRAIMLLYNVSNLPKEPDSGFHSTKKLAKEHKTTPQEHYKVVGL